ncbi:hypothetical protein ACWKWP_02760 [Agromyces soli]
MKPTVVALFIVAGALVPSIAAQAAPQQAAAPAVVVHSAGFGDNPVTDVAGYRASGQADHDARLAAARAAAAQAAADAAAAQAAAEAAAAAAADAVVAAAATESSDWSDDDSGDSWTAPAAEAVAAAPAAEAAPQPTTPRPDNSNCGPCAGADLVWIIYEGVGYWACP